MCEVRPVLGRKNTDLSVWEQSAEDNTSTTEGKSNRWMEKITQFGGSRFVLFAYFCSSD